MLSFKFSNILGATYRGGNLLFSVDGNQLISPVGSRVSAFDLRGNTQKTLDFEMRRDINRIAMSPDGSILVSVDSSGAALVVNFKSQSVLHRLDFKTPVSAIKFSPDGELFAVASGNKVTIWKRPKPVPSSTYVELLGKLRSHMLEVTCLNWYQTASGEYLLITGSKDTSLKITKLIWDGTQLKFSKRSKELFGHRNLIVDVAFSLDGIHAYSVSFDGTLITWATTDPTSEKVVYELEDKTFLDGQVRSCSFHAEKSLLSVGFADGTFAIYTHDSFSGKFSKLHKLSLAGAQLTSVVASPDGLWIAAASATSGAVVVWEWRSETMILKQQGHSSNSLSSMDYSPDGRMIVTGGLDGHVKLWNNATGFCFATFSDHEGPVQAVCFSPNGNVIFSASTDGTIRAYDLLRFRNFRTFLPDVPTQFGEALAVDPSGEVILAASIDDFVITMFAVRTGEVISILAGHEGPITAARFSPYNQTTLVTSSWDKTVKLWEVYSSKNNAPESLQHSSEVLDVVWSPNGRQLAAATREGSIFLWALSAAQESFSIERTIDVRGDILVGRGRRGDITGTRNKESSKHYSTLSFSADGRFLIAGGNHRVVGIYSVATGALVRRIEVTKNLRFEGIVDIVNFELEETFKESWEREDEAGWGIEAQRKGHIEGDGLPGVTKGKFSKKGTRERVQTRSLKVSPDGRGFGFVTNDGVSIYSGDRSKFFDPIGIDEKVTPDGVQVALTSGKYLKALVMSLRLGESKIIERTIRNIPGERGTIGLIMMGFPSELLGRLLEGISRWVKDTRELEKGLLWSSVVLTLRGLELKNMSGGGFVSQLRELQNAISVKTREIESRIGRTIQSVGFVLTGSRLIENDIEDTEEY